LASDTYSRGGHGQITSGGLIIMASSVLSALLVLGALIYASGTSQRHIAALYAAGCEPNLSPSGLQCTTYQMLTSQYVAIVTPVSQQLNDDAAAYTAYEKGSLAAAKAALAAEVTSERAFGTSLAAFPFPPMVAPVAKELIQANQARVTLTSEQAQGSSLTQLRSFNHRVQVASTAVQADMTLVRKAVDTPPPASEG
jgi:hypothetical protein